MLSVSGKARTLLRKMKSVPSRKLDDCFPRCLPDEYVQVWEEFITSTSVADVVKRHGTSSVLTQYYVVAMFLSYVSKYTKLPVPLNSIDLYDPSPQFKVLNSTFYSTKLLKSLGLTYHAHEYTLTADDSSWLRCLIDPTCTGVVTYKVVGRKPLDAMLGNLMPQAFRQIPVELRSDQKFGDAPKRLRKLVTPAQQINSGYGWVVLNENDLIRIEIARARYSTILVRYSFVVPGFYCYGPEDPTKFCRAIRAKHDSFVQLPR